MPIRSMAPSRMSRYIAAGKPKARDGNNVAGAATFPLASASVTTDGRPAKYRETRVTFWLWRCKASKVCSFQRWQDPRRSRSHLLRYAASAGLGSLARQLADGLPALVRRLRRNFTRRRWRAAGSASRLARAAAPLMVTPAALRVMTVSLLFWLRPLWLGYRYVLIPRRSCNRR